MPNNLIVAAQLERGMRYYRLSFPNGQEKLAKTFKEFKEGELALVQLRNNFVAMAVIQEAEDLTLAEMAEVQEWIVASVEEHRLTAYYWAKEEREAEKKLMRAQAIREAKALMQESNIQLEDIFPVLEEKKDADQR